MKLITSLLLLFLASFAYGQGILTFKNNTAEFKNLKADNVPTTANLSFTNTGNQPVIITRVNCISSQVKTDWEKAPILPGKTSEIKLSFVSADMPENFDYSVNVFSNANNSRQQLNVKANIVDNPGKPFLLYKYNMQGLKFKSGILSLDKVYTHQQICDTVYFYNTTAENVKIEPRYLPAYIQVKTVPESVAPNQKGTILITFNAQAKNDYGYCYETILFAINGDMSNYQNHLSLTASIVEDFSKLSAKDIANAPVAAFTKTEVEFGTIKAGEKADCDYTLTNNGKTELVIRKTKAGCGCTAVTMGETRIAPGKSTTIRATFDSNGKMGRQYKSVTVITNDPKNPEIVLTLSGNITEK